MWDIDLNLYKNMIYRNACEKGFYKLDFFDEWYLMMIVTELGEMIQAHRKSKYAFKLKEARFAKDPSIFNVYIKNTMEDEIADVIIRLLSMAGHKGIDLDGTSQRLKEDIEIGDKKKIIFVNPLMFSYMLSQLLTSRNTSTDMKIKYGIMACFIYCGFRNINIKWFIVQKMWYNRHRPYMHGVKY